MDGGFATPKLYDLMKESGQHHLIELKKNAVLSRLLDLSLLCPTQKRFIGMIKLKILSRRCKRFFGDKRYGSSLDKNEVRMMMSYVAYNLYLFLK